MACDVRIWRNLIYPLYFHDFHFLVPWKCLIMERGWKRLGVNCIWEYRAELEQRARSGYINICRILELWSKSSRHQCLMTFPMLWSFRRSVVSRYWILLEKGDFMLWYIHVSMWLSHRMFCGLRGAKPVVCDINFWLPQGVDSSRSPDNDKIATIKMNQERIFLAAESDAERLIVMSYVPESILSPAWISTTRT